MKELWLPITGYPDYEVSNKGRVRSLKFVATRGTPRILKQSISPEKPHKPQYMSVALGVGKLRLRKYIHRLVLIAFVSPPPPGKPQGSHRDGNSLNNWVTNLKWASQIDNEADKRLHGTTARGEAHGHVKLTEQQALEIKHEPYRKGLVMELAIKYGLSRGNVYKIRSGKRWSFLK